MVVKRRAIVRARMALYWAEPTAFFLFLAAIPCCFALIVRGWSGATRRVGKQWRVIKGDFFSFFPFLGTVVAEGGGGVPPVSARQRRTMARRGLFPLFFLLSTYTPVLLSDKTHRRCGYDITIRLREKFDGPKSPLRQGKEGFSSFSPLFPLP